MIHSEHPNKGYIYPVLRYSNKFRTTHIGKMKMQISENLQVDNTHNKCSKKDVVNLRFSQKEYKAMSTWL